jgi:hypothetical protein
MNLPASVIEGCNIRPEYFGEKEMLAMMTGVDGTGGA